MKIFQQTAAPRGQARLAINREAAWFTWSHCFRRVCHTWERQVEKLCEPRLIHLRGGQPYDYTFSFNRRPPGHVPVDKSLLADILFFAEDLYRLEVPARIMLFTDLLDEHFSGRGLHFLFAVFRDLLAGLLNDPMGALYAPLGKRGGDFPLHADLYIPRVLFNVYEEVPDDRSGASMFLPVAEFKRLLGTVGSLPVDTREHIISYLTDYHTADRYTEFYGLLYRGSNGWFEELERKMLAKRFRIKLQRGQGYLINDRAWLHGRETPSGYLSARRLHRLIFDTEGIRRESRTASATRAR